MARILPFRPKLPPERIELYSVSLEGQTSFVIDLIDEDGRSNMHTTQDLADALRSAEWCAEGDGSDADLIPIVNFLDEGGAA